MNENFFNLQKRVNIKKVLITILVIATFILLLYFFTTKKEESELSLPHTPLTNHITNTTTFFNSDRSTYLELPNTYGLKQYASKNEYLIELRSDMDLNIFISSKNKIDGKSLKDIVSADKLAFVENFQTVSNISEIKELLINGNNACTYSFHYLDENLNTTFYIQVSWLEINNNYYVFDIEFPLNDLNNYVNIITDVLNNFHQI